MSARAPYNFIPFHTGDGARAPRAEKVLVRYRDIKELPRHDVIDPALKTGEIHVTLRAETPVFVSDGHKKKELNKAGKEIYTDDPHFFRGANGKLMLPGSAVRGVIRENMQILGFGLIRPGEDLEDYQIYFRQIVGAQGTAAEKLKLYYQDALGVDPGPDGGLSSGPSRVKSGYLCREGHRLYIQPTKSPYIRMPQSSEALIEAELADGVAITVPVTYTLDGGRVSRIRKLGAQAPGEEQGVLLYTGYGIGAEGSPCSRNARYLFPAADERAGRLWISEEDRISYEEDLENRKNTLKPKPNRDLPKLNRDLLELSRSRGEKPAFSDFWKLPRNGEKKPVFYLQHNGHTYFGMSLFLRIGYGHKLSDGLPARRTPRRERDVPLDYPHAVLGFVENDLAYRSRVSFGDFAALGDPREGEDVQVILMQPKPSWYAGYVEGGKNYNEDGFRLRGYKLYWLKEPNIGSNPGKKSRICSVLRPLPPGTEFRGVIRYKNLHPDELGLLLWALRLEEGCCQSVGMGKPYGLGRMTLTIDRLAEYDAGALYRPENLRRIPTVGDRDGVEGYIRAFDEYICGGLRIGESDGEAPSILREPAIQDFFFMRRELRTGEETRYMGLTEYRKSGILPTVREFREEAEAKRRTDAGT